MTRVILTALAAATALSAAEMKTVDDLASYLEKAQKTAAVVDQNAIAAATKASARIEASRTVLAETKDPEETRAIFLSCSLLTESAVAQIAAENDRVELADLTTTLAKANAEAHEAVREIANLERSKSSQLEADLDAEREKARKLREEADKKFSELQSSLIQVSKTARGTIISMSDILFAVGKSDLTADLRTSLAKIAGILTVYKNSNIIIEGHTDNMGGEQFNQTLSEKRAGNVMDFLVAQGVSEERLTSIGFGFTKPIADNATAEGRQKNRRVDLVVQEKKKTEE